MVVSVASPSCVLQWDSIHEILRAINRMQGSQDLQWIFAKVEDNPDAFCSVSMPRLYKRLLIFGDAWQQGYIVRVRIMLLPHLVSQTDLAQHVAQHGYCRQTSAQCVVEAFWCGEVTPKHNSFYYLLYLGLVPGITAFQIRTRTHV